MSIRKVRSASEYETRYGFSRALIVGNRVLVAGTAPIPPVGEDVARTAFEQMTRCILIAKNAMAELGVEDATVIRTRMFITDVTDADDIGRAHAAGFGHDSPTATMVVVAGLLDPAWKIELEVEAVLHRD